ncbi:MAG: pyridoxal phosphate-dependent aminotransferase [Gemmatimonadota bacterium]
MRLSENVRQIEPSGTIAIAALCRELRAKGRDVIDLGVGEPDFRTPDFIAEAGIASIQQGMTQYTPVPGIAPLREAIAKHITTTVGKPADAAGVVVTSGAKQALFNACFTLFGPGDEVLIPAPYWTSYPALVRLARAQPKILETTSEQGFKVSVAALEAAWSPSVRGLIINSPSNPTGAVYTRDELAAIAAWAARRDVWIISDEIYMRICFNAARATSLLDVIDSLDRAVIIDGASKAYAMTGWRLGYSYTSKPLAEQFSTVQSQITSGASSPAQYAATAAYKDAARADGAVRAMASVFSKRRDKVLEHFREHAPEIYCFPPDGAFYVFIRIDNYFSPLVPDSAAFCHWLLENTDVALVPGSAFGADQYARISIAAPNAALEEAVRRMGTALRGVEVRV